MESSNRSRSLRRYLVLGWSSLGWAIALVLFLANGLPKVHAVSALPSGYNPIGLTFEPGKAIAARPSSALAWRVNGIWVGNLIQPPSSSNYQPPPKGYIQLLKVSASTLSGWDENGTYHNKPVGDLYVFVKPF